MCERNTFEVIPTFRSLLPDGMSEDEVAEKIRGMREGSSQASSKAASLVLESTLEQ